MVTLPATASCIANNGKSNFSHYTTFLKQIAISLNVPYHGPLIISRSSLEEDEEGLFGPSGKLLCF